MDGPKDPKELLGYIAKENKLKADVDSYLKKYQGNYTEAARAMLFENNLELDTDQEKSLHDYFGLPVMDKPFIDENWKSDKEVEQLTEKSNELFDKIGRAKKGELTLYDVNPNIAAEGVSNEPLSKAAIDAQVSQYSSELDKINQVLAKNDELRSLGFTKIDESPLGEKSYNRVKREKKVYTWEDLDTTEGFGSVLTEEQKQRAVDQANQREEQKEQERLAVLDQERNAPPTVLSAETAFKNASLKHGASEKDVLITAEKLMRDRQSTLGRQMDMAKEDFYKAAQEYEQTKSKEAGARAEEARLRVLDVYEHMKAQVAETNRAFGFQVGIQKAQEVASMMAAAREVINGNSVPGQIKTFIEDTRDKAVNTLIRIGAGLDDFFAPLLGETAGEMQKRRGETGEKLAMYARAPSFRGNPRERYVDVDGQRFIVDMYGDIQYPVDKDMKPIKGDFTSIEERYARNRDAYPFQYDWSLKRTLGTGTDVAMDMAPIVLSNVGASLIPGGQVKGLHGAVTMGATFFQIYHDILENSLKAGKGYSYAQRSAFANTLVQSYIEKLGGAELRAGKRIGDAAKQALVDRMGVLAKRFADDPLYKPKSFMGEVFETVKEIIPEGGEEMGQSLTGNIFDNLVDGVDSDIDPNEWVNTWASLPFAVIPMSGGSRLIKNASDKEVYKRMYKAALLTPEDQMNAAFDVAEQNGTLSAEERSIKQDMLSNSRGLANEISNETLLTNGRKNHLLGIIADRDLALTEARTSNIQSKKDAATKRAEALENMFNAKYDEYKRRGEEEGVENNEAYALVNKPVTEDEATATTDREPATKDQTGKEPKGQEATQGEAPPTDITTEQPRAEGTAPMVDKKIGFQEAVDKSDASKDASHIANFLLSNASKGDELIDSDGNGYEVTEARTLKNGTNEVILTPFEIVDGKKDYNHTAPVLLNDTDISKKRASVLGVNYYTNSKGERIVDTYTYRAKQEFKQTDEVKTEETNKEGAQPVEAVTQVVPYAPRISFYDVMGEDKVVKKDGVSGVIKVDDGGKVTVEYENNKVEELGNIDDLQGEALSDYGLQVEDVSTIQNRTYKVGDQIYISDNLDEAVQTDEDGNVVSVTLMRVDGGKVAGGETFTGQQAENLAYQIRLDQFSNLQSNEGVRAIEELIPAEEEGVREDVGTGKDKTPEPSAPNPEAEVLIGEKSYQKVGGRWLDSKGKEVKDKGRIATLERKSLPDVEVTVGGKKYNRVVGDWYDSNDKQIRKEPTIRKLEKAIGVKKEVVEAPKEMPTEVPKAELKEPPIVEVKEPKKETVVAKKETLVKEKKEVAPSVETVERVPFTGENGEPLIVTITDPLGQQIDPNRFEIKLHEDLEFAKLDLGKLFTGEKGFKGVRPQETLFLNQGKGYGRVNLIGNEDFMATFKYGASLSYQNQGKKSNVNPEYAKRIAFAYGFDSPYDLAESIKNVAKQERSKTSDIVLDFRDFTVAQVREAQAFAKKSAVTSQPSQVTPQETTTKQQQAQTEEKQEKEVNVPTKKRKGKAVARGSYVTYEGAPYRIHSIGKGYVRIYPAAGPEAGNFGLMKEVPASKLVNIDQSLEAVKKAWNDFKGFGIAFGPQRESAKQKLLLDAIGAYIRDRIILGAKSVKEVWDGIKDFVSKNVGAAVKRLYNDFLEDVKLQERGLSLQQIKDYVREIFAGKAVYERFSPQEQRGFAEGGTIHAEASIILGTDESTNSTSDASPEEQEAKIEEYAKGEGIWFSDPTESITKKHGDIIGSGEESLVWRKDGNTVIKSQSTLMYGNLQEKLDSITLQNTYFPEAPIKVIGFGRNADGDFQVIVEQPFIQAHPTKKVTKAQINEYIEKLGYVYDNESNHATSQTLIEDLHVGNVILTPEENIVVIDPIMRLNTPEQGYGGTRVVSGLQETDREFSPLDAETFNKLLENLNKSIKGVLGGVLSGKEFADKLREQSGRVIRNANRVVYGFVGADGKVYLNGDKINANTPVHEYGHVWIAAMKKLRPDIYKRGLDIADKTRYVKDLLSKKGTSYDEIIQEYRKGNKEPLLEEALAMAIGDRGELIVNQANKKRFKEWLADFWNFLKDFFGGRLTDLTPEQVSNLTPLEFIELAAGQLVAGIEQEGKPSNEGFKLQTTPDAERKDIEDKAKRDGTWMKAPNGKPTNLTEEQWVTVRTKAFKAWFGDWENDPKKSSKVVDENGEPLVVYHGTSEKFTEFEIGTQRSGMPINKIGVWTSSDKDVALNYAGQGDSFFNSGNEDGIVLSIFINARNPLVLKAEKAVEYLMSSVELEKWKKEKDYDISKAASWAKINELKSLIKGHDGLKIIGDYEGTPLRDLDADTWVAFSPNQIKSAEGNTTFDPNTNDIRYQIRTPDGRLVTVKELPQGTEVINGFYSPIEAKIRERISQGKKSQTAEQWLNDFGRTKDETKFTGLSDFLSQKKPKEQVSSQEVLDFIRDNRIQIVEVVKGGLDRQQRMDLIKSKAKSLGYTLKYGVSSGDVYFEKGGKFVEDPPKEIKDLGNEFEDILREDPDKQTETKFGEKSNYREVLVTMPNRSRGKEFAVAEKYGVNKISQRLYGKDYHTLQTNDEKMEVLYEAKKEGINTIEFNNKFRDAGFETLGSFYKSPHFDEPNILVHLRMNERVDSEGNKTLFLEELQSDWGQKGKKEGFRGNFKPDDVVITSKNDEWFYDEEDRSRKRTSVKFTIKGEEDRGVQFDGESDIEFKKRMAELYNSNMGIGMAPYVMETSSWVKLGLRTALKIAAQDPSIKSISWTTGEQQIDRYDLSKTFRTVHVIPNDDGTYIVSGHDLEGRNVFQKNDVKENEVENIVGKEIAEKAIKEKQTRFEGVNLKVGGKGMIGFYGSPASGKLGIIGEVAQGLFGKPKVINIETAKNYTTGEANYVGGIGVYDGKGDMIAEFDTKEEANKFISEKSNQNQHAISITDELRDEVMRGLPQFQIIGERGAQNIPPAKANLDVARDMEASGKDSKTIWLATGWEKGGDGLWRYEVPDLTINGDGLPTGISVAENVITANEIFDAYPQLRTTPIFVIENHEYAGSAATSFPLGTPFIAVYRDGEGGRLVEQRWLTHEFQHVIQRLEGFPEGRSPKTIYGQKISDILQRERDRVEDFVRGVSGEEAITQRLQDYLQQFHPSLFKDAYDEYNRSAGEVEARNAERRRALSQAQRTQTSISETEDVARESQIYLMPDSPTRQQRIETRQQETERALQQAKDNFIQAVRDYFSDPSMGISENPWRKAARQQVLIARMIELAIAYGAKTKEDIEKMVSEVLESGGQAFLSARKYFEKAVLTGINAYNKSTYDEDDLTRLLADLGADMETSQARLREMFTEIESPARKARILKFLHDLEATMMANEEMLFVPEDMSGPKEFKEKIRESLDLYIDPDTKYGRRDQTNYLSPFDEEGAKEPALKPSSELSIQHALKFHKKWHEAFKAMGGSSLGYVEMIADYLIERGQDRISSLSIRRGLNELIKHLRDTSHKNTPNIYFAEMEKAISLRSGNKEQASRLGAAFRSLQNRIRGLVQGRRFEHVQDDLEKVDEFKGEFDDVEIPEDLLDTDKQMENLAKSTALKDMAAERKTVPPTNKHRAQAKKNVAKTSAEKTKVRRDNLKEAIKKCR